MVDELNYNGIEFPVTINQINKIEKQNNININVLGFENDYPFPFNIHFRRKVRSSYGATLDFRNQRRW